MKNKNLGASKLASTIQKRMNAVYDYKSSASLEFGTITENLGLKIDNFPDTIPNGNYTVCRSLMIPDNTLHLSKGNRVLIGWSNGEPVVIDRLL